MSASEIETNEILVSADTDLTKLSAEELLAVVAELRQENKVLKKAKDKVGLTFKRVPEDGNDSIVRLEDNQFPFLTKVESLSVTKPKTNDGNIALIEAENLAALATLQMTHKEKVDVIYIDPPYNTGNDDFIYEDKRIYKSDKSDLENLEQTLDGKARTVGKDDPFRHSKWLSFMERRLFLAKELLSDTGVIFVSLDNNEQARLKLLMDSVFGEENFIDTIIWEKSTSTINHASFFSTAHEYILVYKKSNWTRQLIPRTTKQLSQYKYNDNDGKGLYTLSDLSVARNTPSDRYPIINPNTGKENYPTSGRSWGVSKETLKALIEENALSFGASGNGMPMRKRYLKDVQQGVVPRTIFMAKDSDKENGVGETQYGTKQVMSILGGDAFVYPKPTLLIKKLLQIASAKKDALILDFFAGSGTTGHAVAELNKEDGGNRSAILVTNNEGGIARNVTRERLARVLTGENWADGKEHEALPGNLSYYRLDFKKLSANPLSTAQMMESKFDGLLSLENNALTVVENNPDEDYAIYRNSGKVVFVWKNLFSLYDGECEELLESLKASTKADEFIAYVPSDSLDAGITVDGWKIIPFPHDYINRYEAMIATMRRNKTLPNSK